MIVSETSTVQVIGVAAVGDTARAITRWRCHRRSRPRVIAAVVPMVMLSPMLTMTTVAALERRLPG
jgi:hypothetical protein